jgi:acetyltransferase-like isoleucine patch superfamily enzyme
MAMMNSTRAILLFVLGTCLYQLSLAEEGTGALYRHIAMLSARGMEMNVVHVSKLPDDSVREQSVRRERDVNAEGLALATMVGCTAGSECTNYPDCTPGRYCTAKQCTSGECTGDGGCTGDVQCTKNSPCTSGHDCTYGRRCTRDPKCTAGKNCTAGDNCTAGRGCTAGWRCTVGNGCTKSDNCTIGRSCTSHAHNGCTSGRNPHDPSQFCTSGPHCTIAGVRCPPAPVPVPAPVTPTASGLVATIWQLLFGYSILSIIRLQRQL